MSDQVTLTVDGIDVTVPAGTLVVDAAKKVKVDIPVFCYHPKMEPVGMCRMCLVEIGVPMRDRATGELMLNDDGTPQINFGRGLQTGCTVRVSEGMVVRTQTEVVDDAREDVIEFLLTSHPLDCPICDKGGECPLQNLTMEHGKGTSRMHYSDKMHQKKHVPLGDLIYLDRERCIQCGRCTRFQAEIVDDPVIHFHNRGRRLEIVTLSDPGFDSYWSGNTTDICPVGALTSADFRFGARPWELTPVSTVSVHSPAGSNMTLSTRREARAGGGVVIKRIMPRQNELVNEIWISDRDRFVYHFSESAERVTTPMVRRNGSLEPATWDEALDRVAGKLQQHKGAVAGLSGDRVSNEDLFAFQHLLRDGLGSNHIDLVNRRLAGGDVVAKVGVTSPADASNPQRLGKGDAILVVASDLHEEEPIWWLRAKQASERGATVVTLNLRETRLDKFATHALRYAPGGALEAARNLVNAAKVEAGSDDPLAVAAKALVEADNLVIFYGYEGLNYEETDALARLMGNLLLVQNSAGSTHVGRPNNGLIPVWPHNNTQGAWDMGVHPAFGPGYAAIAEPGLDENGIYKASAEGDVSALYVVAADPIGDGLMADRGKLDFLVVQELFLTETAQAADVVLPAQTWVEREGTFTSGERRVQRYYPAVTPRGEARADWQILAQVGERIGMEKPAFAASLVFRDLAKKVAPYKGLDYRTLAITQDQWPDVGGEDLYYGGNAYENRTGLGEQWPIASAETPFDVPAIESSASDGLNVVWTAALYTPGTLINESEMLADRLARPSLYVNPADAGTLTDLGRVAVTIGDRTVDVTVHLDEHAPQGVACLRGVPFVAGTNAATLTPIEIKEEVVA